MSDTSLTSKELADCPRCGGDPGLVFQHPAIGPSLVWVKCECGLRGIEHQYHHGDEKEAMAAARAWWNERRTDEPPARQCNHGAISPKGTLFYHGFVGPANYWRCDVCKGVFEGNLTEPTKQGGQLLTLVNACKCGPGENCSDCSPEHETPRASEPPPESRDRFRIGDSVRTGPWPHLSDEYSKVMTITGVQYYLDHKYGPYRPDQLVRVQVANEVQHAVTCKLFPDPHDEREPVGPCTCGAETKEAGHE